MKEMVNSEVISSIERVRICAFGAAGEPLT